MSRFATGIHLGLDASVYHEQFAVSNSDLKLFRKGPAYYYAAKVLGKPEDDGSTFDEDEDDEDGAKEPNKKRAFVLGTVLHAAVLEPHLFGRDLSHYVKPATYTNDKGETKKWTGNANTCKRWLAEHRDKPVLTEKEERRIIGARDAIFNHPTAGALLSGPGSNEASVFAVDPETGLNVRMRADRLTDDADGRPWIVDIKSCQDVNKFERTAREFSYHVQDSYYRWILDLVGVKNAAFAFIAVELVPKYGIHAVRVVEMDVETKELAASIYRRDLEAFARCKETGVWPLPHEEIEPCAVRNWN